MPPHESIDRFSDLNFSRFICFCFLGEFPSTPSSLLMFIILCSLFFFLPFFLFSFHYFWILGWRYPFMFRNGADELYEFASGLFFYSDRVWNAAKCYDLFLDVKRSNFWANICFFLVSVCMGCIMSVSVQPLRAAWAEIGKWANGLLTR